MTLIVLLFSLKMRSPKFSFLPLYFVLMIMMIMVMAAAVETGDCSKQIESYTSTVCRDSDDVTGCQRCVDEETKMSNCQSSNKDDCQHAIFCLEREILERNCTASTY